MEQRLAPHLDALHRAAYRLCRHGPDAEDLVQEVCVRAFGNTQSFAAADSPRAWLLRVLFNLHVDQARRQRATTPLDEATAVAEGAAAAARDPAASAERWHELDALAQAWPALTEEQQALLALYAEGYRLKEIVAITGLPLSALKARLHRARVRLGKLLAADAGAEKAAAVSGDSA